MSESHDRTLPATPRRREDARNKGLAPTGAVLGWPAMAAVVLVALPIWFRATVSAAVAAIENIQMTGKGGSYHVFLPLIFPTIVVVVLALGVLLLVRTLFDGAAWRIDRLVFRFERIDPSIGLQRIVSAATVVRAVLSFVGFAVPISKYLYTSIESAEIISDEIKSFKFKAVKDFPVHVVPVRTINFFLLFSEIFNVLIESLFSTQPNLTISSFL